MDVSNDSSDTEMR